MSMGAACAIGPPCVAARVTAPAPCGKVAAMSPALRLLARRSLEALLTLWLLATLCFVLLRAAPGGPFDSEKAAPPEVQAALDAQYRLDRPLIAQYGAWLGDVVRGDL